MSCRRVKGFSLVTRRTTNELVVFDQEQRCPYLFDRVARLPLRAPTAPLAPSQFDEQLASGTRRTGSFLYRTACPSCCACEPIRLDVAAFSPSRSQQRVLRRGDRTVALEFGPPLVDERRISMFNLHRRLRGLAHDDGDLDADDYYAFLVDTCCETFEMRQYVDGELTAVAICDQGEAALSAVYCYFDPHNSDYSPGVYSILKQIEYCRRRELRHLYLGLYIAESPHMAYKARFLPHERLIDGRWRCFQRQ